MSADLVNIWQGSQDKKLKRAKGSSIKKDLLWDLELIQM